MRLVLFLVLALSASLSLADKSAQEMVFRDECAKLDKKAVGFECRSGDLGLEFYIYEPLSKLSAERKKSVETGLDRMALRYLELGGQRFTYQYAGQSKKAYCYRKKNVSYPDFYCL